MTVDACAVVSWIGNGVDSTVTTSDVSSFKGDIDRTAFTHVELLLCSQYAFEIWRFYRDVIKARSKVWC